MAEKRILKKVAEYLKSEKSLRDDTEIVVEKDSVKICSGENNMILGYMLRLVYVVAGVYHLDYYVSTDIDDNIYLIIY